VSTPSQPGHGSPADDRLPPSGTWQQPPGAGSGPWSGGPQGPWPGGPQQTSTKAVVALVLALLTWTPALPLVGAVVALVVASLARREILDSGGRLTGLGLVTATKVLAWSHLVLLLVAGLVLGVLLVLGFGVGLPYL
jgi:hypothetical protein